MLIEKIQNLGYRLNQDGTGDLNGCAFYRIVSPTGKETIVPFNEVPLFIGTGGCRNAEEAEQRVASGTGMKTDGLSIYAEIYPPEQLCLAVNGYSLCTDVYLHEIMDSIGLTKIDEREFDRPLDGEKISHYPGRVNSGEVYIVKLQGGSYCAAVQYQANIDAFPEIRMFFKDAPSTADVDTALTIRDVKAAFFAKKVSETFRCWECGNDTFWLDIPGDLKRKLNCAESKFCGKCDAE